MIRASVATVGVAPGTTTLRLDGATAQCGQRGGISGPNCPGPIESGWTWKPSTGKPWTPTELTSQKSYRIYGDRAQLKSAGLGIVLSPYGKVPGAAPWEINRTGPSITPNLTPFDPQYNQRGERGWYYDTPLGAIPTDAELSKNLCYTPVESGWVYGNNSYIPGPWVPPNGWNPAGQWGPPTSLSGLGFVDNVTTHNRLILLFTAISATAIALSAYYTIKRGCRR